ncbi:hypothetical protein ACFX13_046495 [Malus domestica]
MGCKERESHSKSSESKSDSSSSSSSNPSVAKAAPFYGGRKSKQNGRVTGKVQGKKKENREPIKKENELLLRFVETKKGDGKGAFEVGVSEIERLRIGRKD